MWLLLDFSLAPSHTLAQSLSKLGHGHTPGYGLRRGGEKPKGEPRVLLGVAPYAQGQGTRAGSEQSWQASCRWSCHRTASEGRVKVRRVVTEGTWDGSDARAFKWLGSMDLWLQSDGWIKITVRRVDNTYDNKRMCQGELSRESSEQASVLCPGCWTHEQSLPVVVSTPVPHVWMGTE